MKTAQNRLRNNIIIVSIKYGCRRLLPTSQSTTVLIVDLFTKQSINT